MSKEADTLTEIELVSVSVFLRGNVGMVKKISFSKACFCDKMMYIIIDNDSEQSEVIGGSI